MTTEEEYYKIFRGCWDEYLEKLNDCCDMVKLTAYHTKIAGERAGKAANEALLTAQSINKYLNNLPIQLLK